MPEQAFFNVGGVESVLEKSKTLQECVGSTVEVQLVSPEQVLYIGEADMVVVRTLGGGDIAFLARPRPVPRRARQLAGAASMLEDGTQERFAVHGGFVEVVERPRDRALRRRRAPGRHRRRPRAKRPRPAPKKRCASNADDEEAQAALARAEVRLEVAGA